MGKRERERVREIKRFDGTKKERREGEKRRRVRQKKREKRERKEGERTKKKFLEILKI